VYFYCQIFDGEEDAGEAPKARCNPANLFAVLGGMKYHLACGNGVCTLSRDGSEIVVEIEAGRLQAKTYRVPVTGYEEELMRLCDEADMGFTG
jgi:hypothetical protein